MCRQFPATRGDGTLKFRGAPCPFVSSFAHAYIYSDILSSPLVARFFSGIQAVMRLFSYVYQTTENKLCVCSLRRSYYIYMPHHSFNCPHLHPRLSPLRAIFPTTFPFTLYIHHTSSNPPMFSRSKPSSIFYYN